MLGYLDPLYARSFSEIGEPIFLPVSRGWLIKRQIPGTNYFDAMGPYPLFFCENWNALSEDLNNLKSDLVSISLVIGPLMQFPIEIYKDCFDSFYAYKDHYLLDLSLPLGTVVSSNRRKDARRALQKLTVDIKIAPDIDHQEWFLLYQNLAKRHAIKGIRAFSELCFIDQLAIPGMHFFRASYAGKVIGGSLYLVQGDTVYFHLSAFLDEGYDLDASYAVKWLALQYFAGKVRWMNLGGSTTNSGGLESGLDRFKKGWSSTTAKSYYCGKVLNPEIYQALAFSHGNVKNGWFPAYRSGDY